MNMSDHRVNHGTKELQHVSWIKEKLLPVDPNAIMYSLEYKRQIQLGKWVAEQNAKFLTDFRDI
jgi:hypothetical protein